MSICNILALTLEANLGRIATVICAIKISCILFIFYVIKKQIFLLEIFYIDFYTLKIGILLCFEI